VVPRPSNLRKAEKDWLLEQLAQPQYADLMAEAEAVYQDYEAYARGE